MGSKNDTCAVHLRETIENRKSIDSLANVVEDISKKIFVGNGKAAIIARIAALEIREKIYIAVFGFCVSINITLLGVIVAKLFEMAKYLG